MKSLCYLANYSLAVAASLVLITTCVYAASPSPTMAVKKTAEKVDSADKLPALALAAKSSFHAVTKAELQTGKTKLADAVSKLADKLDTEEPNAAELKKFLLWNDMRDELSKKQPDLAVLGKTAERFTGGHEGLAKVWFTDVRDSLKRYTKLAAGLDNPALKSEYETRMDRLSTRLAAYVAKPSAAAALEIRDDISWLEDLHQAPELIKAVRERLVQPNLYAQISSDLLNAGIGSQVDDVRKVRDCILRTDINGTAHTTGKTSLVLVPDPKKGVAEIVLKARANSNSVGAHGNINVFTTGVSTIEARKRILIDVNGIKALPACSNVDTNTCINDVSHNCGRQLIERAAWKQANKKLDLAECIASDHTSVQINQKVDDEAAKMLADANKSFDTRFRAPLKRYNVFPQTVRFSTLSDAIKMVALEADSTELAAPSIPPVLDAEADVKVQIHESMFNNFAATALADMCLDKETLYDLVLEVTEDADRADEMAGGEGNWMMKFAHWQPLSVEFVENGIKLVFRGSQFWKDKGAAPYEAMNVSAEYKIEKTEKGFKAVRGELVILPPRFASGKGENLSPGESGAIPLLKKRFQKMFAPEIVIEDIEIDGNWRNAGKLRPVRLICDNGWLSIAWNRIPLEKPAEKNVAKNSN
jgi:hypothetical protein